MKKNRVSLREGIAYAIKDTAKVDFIRISQIEVIVVILFLCFNLIFFNFRRFLIMAPFMYYLHY